MQAMKTGALFSFACEAGAVLGRADEFGKRTKAYAAAFGQAFQLADDLLDAEGDEEAVGKAVAKDAGRGKATLVALLGVAEAARPPQGACREAEAALAPFGDKAATLKDAATYRLAPRLSCIVSFVLRHDDRADRRAGRPRCAELIALRPTRRRCGCGRPGEATLDIVVDHRLEFAGDAGPRKVATFLPSTKTGAVGSSPVPGSEMPISACLDSPGPLTMQPMTASAAPRNPDTASRHPARSRR